MLTAAQAQAAVQAHTEGGGAAIATDDSSSAAEVKDVTAICFIEGTSHANGALAYATAHG